jgi:hypothetical protein
LYSEYCSIFVLEIETIIKEKSKTLLPMKNTKTMIVAAMMAMTIATYASAENSTYKVEEKARITVMDKALPASLPVLESPAPQSEKLTVDTNKHSAAQKAAIVGLQLKSASAK